MARKIFVELVDDLDGESPATETISFGIDGVIYELDLSAPNATELRNTLSDWVLHARKVGRTRTEKGVKIKVADPLQNAVIRQWARDNGYDVQDRGRILNKILAAYRAQHESAPR